MSLSGICALTTVLPSLLLHFCRNGHLPSFPVSCYYGSWASLMQMLVTWLSATSLSRARVFAFPLVASCSVCSSSACPGSPFLGCLAGARRECYCRACSAETAKPSDRSQAHLVLFSLLFLLSSFFRHWRAAHSDTMECGWDAERSLERYMWQQR